MSALLSQFEHIMTQLLGEQKPKHVALAVSGGADSMALALLAKQWADGHTIQVTALIVDHGLRAESADEAQCVAQWLRARHIPVNIMAISMPELRSALQETARHKRYEAMTTWCNQQGVTHLLLGHHAGDQAETMLLRLLKQSRFDGLAGMSAKRMEHDVALLRPLLACEKADLIEFLKAEDQGWVEDPSNKNTNFTRVKMRELLAAYPLAQPRLARIAQGFGRIRQKRSMQLEQAFERYVTCCDAGIVAIDDAMFAQLPPSFNSAILWHIVDVLGQTGHSPRHHKIDALVGALANAPIHTIGGCMVEHINNRWVVYPEAAHVPERVLMQGGGNHWSNYWVQWNHPAEGWSIGTLCENERVALKDDIPYSDIITPRTIMTLPVIRHLEAVQAIPHIGYYSEDWSYEPLKPQFFSAKPLGKWPFFAMNNT